MLRFGTITQYSGTTGLAKVEFKEDGIVTDWLPITVMNSLDTKAASPLDPGEHVVCLMDSACEHGVILGAVYSKDEKPEGGGTDIYCVEFKSGDRIEYNRLTRKYKIKIGTSEYQLTQLGHTIKRGAESLKLILSDLMVALQAETHGTGVGPSTPPLNALSYVSLQARLGTLFEA